MGMITAGVIILLSCFLPEVRPDCLEIAHNGCTGDDNDAYLKLNRERDLCQQDWEIEPQCQFYRWRSDNNLGYNCFLYEEKFTDYIHHCAKISGPKNPQGNCIAPSEGTCDVTQSSSCEYDGLDCREIFGPKDKLPTDCGEAPATTSRPGTTITPPGPHNCPVDSELTVYPDEDECSFFWECYKGVWTHRQCSDCNLFDINTGFCNFPRLVDCGSRPHDENCEVTTAPGDCPLKYGYFPDNDNCMNYVVCDAGKPTFVKCAEKVDESGVTRQLLCNEDVVQCDWTYRVTCGNRPICDRNYQHCQCQNAEEADANNPCSGVVGTQVIGNPFDCSQQLVCMDGILLDTVSCDDGQYYDPSIQNCSPDESVCKDRPVCATGSGGSTTCYCV